MALNHFHSPTIGSRASFRAAAMIALLAAVALLPESPSFAKGAPTSLVKTTAIEGTAAECGAGVRNGWIARPLTIKLHELSSKRVVAIYTIEPTPRVGDYAFNVVPGIYYLTTSESTSVPPRGNIIIHSNSKAVVEANITTVCQ
jgi:hypothetical protein